MYKVKVNNNIYNININNDLDDLIKKMGFEIGVSKLINEIKAPMPGLILDIIAEVGQEVTILFSDSEQVNAFALPGRVIVINKGLVGKAASENEISFVLAHELGHIENRDHLRGIGRSLVLMTFSAMLLGPDNGVGKMLGKGLHLSEMKFSRVQESRADS